MKVIRFNRVSDCPHWRPAFYQCVHGDGPLECGCNGFEIPEECPITDLGTDIEQAYASGIAKGRGEA